MKKPLMIVTAALLATSTVAACGPTLREPGTYKHTETSVDKQGTKTTKTENTTVYRDADGNKRAIEETETTRDPEGLFNKSTRTTTRTYN